VLNPVESKVTSFSALTQYDFEPILNANPSVTTIDYNPNYENVEYLTITILRIQDNTLPSKVQLGIFACADGATIATKGVIEDTTPNLGSTVSYSTQVGTETTTKKCDEMPAIDESTARHITVSPTDLPESQKVSFQPTSPTGVSFPSDEITPTITVNFGKPAELQSVVLPRDKTPSANVQQFEVTFYSTDGQKINPQPVKSTISPSTDTKTPASLNPQDIPSDKPVSRLDIKVLSTTDSQSPKGVILDIKACTEAISSKLHLLSYIKQFQYTILTLSFSTATPGSTPSGQTAASTVSRETTVTTLPGQTTGSTVNAQTTGTTPKKCDEMPAIDEQTARHITVSPTDLPESQKVSFQPTSPNGVSFPSNETTPTITVNFVKPAEVQSVVLPRDKTPGANVQQFEVTFYSPDGQKINQQPVKSTVSPSTDNKTPASLNPQDIPSDKPVSRLDIKVLSTTDGQSPKGVILDIKACTEISPSKFKILSDVKQFLYYLVIFYSNPCINR